MINPQKILIWLARLISSVAAVFFLLFAVSEGGLEILIIKGEIRLEGILFAAFLIFAVVSTGIAFWRVKPGAYFLLVSGLCLAIFTFVIASQNKMLIAFVMGGPFVVSAILLYLATSKKRSREIIVMKSASEEV